MEKGGNLRERLAEITFILRQSKEVMRDIQFHGQEVEKGGNLREAGRNYIHIETA